MKSPPLFGSVQNVLIMDAASSTVRCADIVAEDIENQEGTDSISLVKLKELMSCKYEKLSFAKDTRIVILAVMLHFETLGKDIL